MLCTCIANVNASKIREILSDNDIEMAEIRLDSCLIDTDEIVDIFSKTDIPLIATCRIDICGDEHTAYRKLSSAIEAGAAFVDLEIEASSEMTDDIRDTCDRYGCRLIRSYHNFVETPSLDTLIQIRDMCLSSGADIVKIVTTANSVKDIQTIESLYVQSRDCYGFLIAFAMGESGRLSRMNSIRLGAPFMYASYSSSDIIAPGQHYYKDLVSKFSSCRYEKRSIEMPASKSLAQRAIIMASLAQGKSLIKHVSLCDDVNAAISIAESLGSKVSFDGSYLTIENNNTRRCETCISVVNVGESAFLARVMIPLMGLMNPGSIITGEGTLLNRELKGVVEVMSRFGISAESLSQSNSTVPIRIDGKMTPAEVDIDGRNGSQLISGLLISLPLINGDSVLRVHHPVSVPYINMTVDMLSKFGIDVSIEELDDLIEIRVKGGQSFSAASLDLEGDWSAAANFLVAGALFGRVSIANLSNRFLQADFEILSILESAGVKPKWISETECLTVKSALRPFEANLNNAPDLFPIVSLLAAFCSGESHIFGLQRLINKESNRAESIISSLIKMGVTVTADENVLSVSGESLSSRIMNNHLLKGDNYSSFHDHRIAMMLKIASLASDSPIEIDDLKCISKSCPTFLEILKFG